MPSSRPLDRRGEQRLLHGVLARVEAPVAADEHAEDLRRQRAQQVHVVVGRAHISAPAASMSGRTSSGVKRALGPARGDLGRALGALAVDDEVAGQVLLGLGERAVGDRRRAVDDADRLGVRRVGQRLAADQLAGLGELLS